MPQTDLRGPARQASRPRFIDTHCHLDDDAFADDLNDVLSKSVAVGVNSWINVGYSPERWRSTITLASRQPGVAVMLGLHPNESARWTPAVHRELAALLKQADARAVGETGIDLFRGEKNVDQQRTVFEAQLALAVELEMPAVIHMRAAETQVLDTLRNAGVLPRLLFHSFDGGRDLLNFVIDTGSFVGIGGLATRPKSVQLRDQLLRVPLSQMVLETDSPYLLPATVPGGRNGPQNIPIIASFLADLVGRDVANIAEVTTRNAEKLFGELGAA